MLGFAGPSTKLLLPISIGGQVTYRAPPKFAPWWKFDIFDSKTSLISTASDRIQWCSGVNDLLDAELGIRRVNDRPEPDLEHFSEQLRLKQEK
jgi:hypothetical protein